MAGSMDFVKPGKKELPIVSIHQPENCIGLTFDGLDQPIADLVTKCLVLGYGHVLARSADDRNADKSRRAERDQRLLPTRSLDRTSW